MIHRFHNLNIIISIVVIFLHAAKKCTGGLAMAVDYEIKELRRVSLKDLVIGKGQVRKDHVEKELTELADSIKVVGQLHPIVVCPHAEQPGKFEIIIGQRRFLAIKILGRDDIWAEILNRTLTEEEARILSGSENLLRTAVSKKDWIDWCTGLWKIYGDVQIIHNETGLPPNKIREYIKYDSLSTELKVLVDKGVGSDGVDMKAALRVQKALEKTGEADPDVKVALAKQMQGMIGAHQEKLAQAVETGMVKTIEDISDVVDAVKKQPKYVKISVTLDEGHNKALTKYAITEGMNREEAAHTLITEALDELSEEEE